MFNAAGSVTSEHADETIALQTIQSPIIDVSANPTDIPLLFDADYQIGVQAVDFYVVTANDGLGGEFRVGTLSDARSIVSVENLDSDVIGSKPSRSVVNATLATTLVDSVFKHGGKPIVPAATQIVCAAEGPNTASGYIQLTYWKVQPST